MRHFTDMYLDEMLIMSSILFIVTYFIFSFLCYISKTILDWLEANQMQEKLQNVKKKRDRKRSAQQKIPLAGD